MFHSVSVIADGVDECLKSVREELRQGAHCIKIMGSGGVASPTDPIWMNQYRNMHECREFTRARRCSRRWSCCARRRRSRRT